MISWSFSSIAVLSIYSVLASGERKAMHCFVFDFAFGPIKQRGGGGGGGDLHASHRGLWANYIINVRPPAV